jgi:hypothetical protein
MIVANNFVTFFEDKINKIYKDLMKSAQLHQTCIPDMPLSSCKLEQFDVVTSDELRLMNYFR